METKTIETETKTDDNFYLRFSRAEAAQFVANIDKRIMLYKYIYRMIYLQKRTVIVVIEGERGTGKSYLALKIASEIDIFWKATSLEEAERIVRERVVIKPSQYIELVNSPHLRRGSVIILDEAGVGIPAREWQSINNRAISYLTQVFRHKGLIVILTVPAWEFIDVQIREAINIKIKTLFIDRRQKLVVCKVQEVKQDESNPGQRELRFTYFRAGNMRFKRNRFHKVNKFISSAYEKYSLEFKEGIEKELEHRIKKTETPTDKVHERENQENAAVKTVLSNLESFSGKYHGVKVVSAIKIRSILGLSRDIAFNVKIKVDEELKKQNSTS